MKDKIRFHLDEQADSEIASQLSWCWIKRQRNPTTEAAITQCQRS